MLPMKTSEEANLYWRRLVSTSVMVHGRIHAATCLQAGMHAAQALAEQLQKELEAEHEARLAVTKEKAELQMQLEVEKAASRANAQTKVSTCHVVTLGCLLQKTPLKLLKVLLTNFAKGAEALKHP